MYIAASNVYILILSTFLLAYNIGFCMHCALLSLLDPINNELDHLNKFPDFKAKVKVKVYLPFNRAK